MITRCKNHHCVFLKASSYSNFNETVKNKFGLVATNKNKIVIYLYIFFGNLRPIRSFTTIETGPNRCSDSCDHLDTTIYIHIYQHATIETTMRQWWPCAESHQFHETYQQILNITPKIPQLLFSSDLTCNHTCDCWDRQETSKRWINSCTTM